MLNNNKSINQKYSHNLENTDNWYGLLRKESRSNTSITIQKKRIDLTTEEYVVSIGKIKITTLKTSIRIYIPLEHKE